MELYLVIENILKLYDHDLIEKELNKLEESKVIKKWDFYTCNTWFIKSREYEVTDINGKKINRFVYKRRC